MSGSANCPRFPPLALPSANRPRFLLALQESAGEGSCRGTEQRRLSRPAAVRGRCGRGTSGGACKEGWWHAHGRRQASASDVHEVRSRHPARYGTPSGTPKPHTGSHILLCLAAPKWA